MKKAIRDSLAKFNREWIIKEWAILALITSLVLMLGTIELIAMYYSHIQYSSAEAVVFSQPSLMGGWVTAVIGLVFLYVSTRGMKIRKKNLGKGKVKAQERR